MSIESAGPASAGRWRRLLAWLQEVSEAVETSYDELQDRRITALEFEVRRLRGELDRQAGSVPET